jgi:hypothetical protein
VVADVTTDEGATDISEDVGNDFGTDEGTDLPQGSDEGTEDVVDPPSLFSSDSRTMWSMEISGSSTDSCYALGGEDLLVRQGDELHWMGSPGDVVLEGPEGFDPQDIVAVDQSGLGHLVIATHNALYVTNDGTLELSPLSEALAETTISDLLIARKIEGDVLWIATSDGIHRWEDDMVQSLDLGDVPSSDVQFAWGAPLNSGIPALWVNAGSHVYAITHNGTSAIAWVEQADRNVESITVDGSGRLWMVTDEGVELRQSNGYWHPAPLEYDVSSFTAHRDKMGTYAVDADGDVHHILGQVSWHIMGEGTLLCSDGMGRLITADNSGLIRHHPWEDISISGLTNGGGLEADLDSTPASVSIQLSYLDLGAEDGVVSAEDAGLSAELNGEALDLGDVPVNLTFDPWQLESGDYILTVRRTIAGDNPWDPPTEGQATVEQNIYFSSDRPYVSWDDDIQDLHMSFCNDCHGQAGHLPNELKFYNYAQWTANYYVILSYVGADLMPPGSPLSPENILLLKYWGLAQFPE